MKVFRFRDNIEFYVSITLGSADLSQFISPEKIQWEIFHGNENFRFLIYFLISYMQPR